MATSTMQVLLAGHWTGGGLDVQHNVLSQFECAGNQRGGAASEDLFRALCTQDASKRRVSVGQAAIFTLPVPP